MDDLRPMHLVIYRKKSVKTACGIRLAARYPDSDEALPMTGEKIRATTIKSKVTCKRCGRPPGRATHDDVAKVLNKAAGV